MDSVFHTPFVNFALVIFILQNLPAVILINRTAGGPETQALLLLRGRIF